MTKKKKKKEKKEAIVASPRLLFAGLCGFYGTEGRGEAMEGLSQAFVGVRIDRRVSFASREPVYK